MQDPKAHEQAMRDELRAYSKLEKINKSSEFNDFFAFQIDEAAKKMLTCFTGTGPQSYDEFCRIRGEVIGVLYPIQQVRGAKYVQEEIKSQLNEYYNSEPS